MKKTTTIWKTLTLSLGIGAITSFLVTGISYAATPVSGGSQLYESSDFSAEDVWETVSSIAEPVDMEILTPYMDSELLQEAKKETGSEEIAEILQNYCEKDSSFLTTVCDYFVVGGTSEEA